MSYIRFQDHRGAADLNGRERPRLLTLAQGAAADTLRSSRAREAAGVMDSLLPSGHYLRGRSGHQAERWLSDYATALAGLFDEPIVEHQGDVVGTDELVLNTALALGSDAVKLAVRLYAQCEINCWVAAVHRPWLAAVVDEGLDAGTLRAEAGWAAIARLLRSADDGPVVTSFSGSFPVEDSDDWELMTDAERWDHGLEGLLARPEDRIELTPDGWSDYRFGSGLSLLDLFALAEGQPERFDRAFGIESPQDHGH
jgi:hypothetical protein